MREIREAEKQSIRGLREDWKWIFSIEIRLVYTYPLSTGFDDSAVAESAYPERRAGFRSFLAPVPNKVVYEVQCHLDLRGVERFWGNDVNEMKEKKKKNPNFIQFINFFVKEKKKKNIRLPSKVWEGQTSFLTISLSRSDKIWIFSDILHGVNLSKMYNTSFIRHIMFSMSLGFCRHNRITSICKRRGGEEWAESF